MDVAILFALIISLLLIGVPIAVALGLSSTVFLLVLSDSSLGSDGSSTPTSSRSPAASSIRLSSPSAEGISTGSGSPGSPSPVFARNSSR